MRVLVVSFAAVLAALAVTVDPARGCSCVQPDPWSYLKQADGAFVGRLVSRREADQGNAVLVFSVEQAVKGRIGSTVEVETANSGAGCGIETSIGTRIGLFIDRDGDRWLGHLCWQLAPEDLLAAAALPSPNGRGAAAALIGGRFGPARMMAVDAKGRTLAYGSGGGHSRLFATCPGSRILAEVAAIRSDERMRVTYEIAVRETPSLRVLRRHRARLPGHRFAAGLLCEDSEGSSVVMFANWAGDAPNNAAIYRLTGGRIRAVWQGAAFLSSFDRGIAYLNEGTGANRLASVDLSTGRMTPIVWLPRSPSLVPNRSGTRLAGVAYGPAERSRLVLVDLTNRPPTVRSTPLVAPDVHGDLVWVSSRLLLFVPSDARARARVLDLELRTRSRFRWTAGQGALVNGAVFGVEGRSLVAAKLPYGPARVVRQLPGRATLLESAAPG